MNKFGLESTVIKKIQKVFSEYNEIESVILYGSRAKGNYKNGSDIDLTLKTNNKEREKILFRIIDDVDKANIIYKFDISLFSQINDKDLIKHINQKGCEFYNKKGFKSNEEYKQKQQSYQSEQELENELIKELKSLKYEYVNIQDDKDLIKNLKIQIEKHNNISLTEKEFEKVLNHLNKGNIFERAGILRDKMQLTKEDGTSVYIGFINQRLWCQNQFQVTNQVNMEGKYKNRYDVTILINGLPLAHIELKRRGIELKEAFNQIQRYKKHSFNASYGLFNYIQIFIISNGVNTKYYANNKKIEFNQTFFWADEDNNKITQLKEFTREFLEPCHLSKMICRYIVLSEGKEKILMVLRSYQYYATEKIIDRVENTSKNGYIWHTTGSGKTLTSFKTSQILKNVSKIDKVFFVVDRKDLDYQTIKEFDNFSKGSVDATENTKDLIRKCESKTQDTKLIVTTIQKLNNAIKNMKNVKKIEILRDKRIIFIFDECHRTQFGEMNERIKKFFNNYQFFGFTGTPIFEENANKTKKIVKINNEKEGVKKQTTKDIFGECLHKYLIVDAIQDENVLRFLIEYVGKYKNKKDNSDRQVEGINTKEYFESDERIEKIVEYIVHNHKSKTYDKEFNSMFCVGSIDILIKYYEMFKRWKKEGKTDLKVATIFSWTNEEDSSNNKEDKHKREKLDEFIEDYNKEYGTNFSTRNKGYYKNISKRVKDKEVDIFIVDNMFLTGFDAKCVNTLYVDKNLQCHTLIQAFSRTNRIYGAKKQYGNIISFRNLKTETDEAITLFSNGQDKECVLIKSYKEYIDEFNKKLEELEELSPDVSSLNNNLISDLDELNFVKIFRELLRIYNIISPFEDFDFTDIKMDLQKFEDYKSKYLDIYDKVKGQNQKEKDSILNDIDFKLELIHRDDITASYILQLLSNLRKMNEEVRDKTIYEILDKVSKSVQLRSKKELIEEFINNQIIKLNECDDIEKDYNNFFEEKKNKALNEICDDENLKYEEIKKIVSSYLFSGLPMKHYSKDITDIACKFRPKLMEIREIRKRIVIKLEEFIEKYI